MEAIRVMQIKGRYGLTPDEAQAAAKELYLTVPIPRLKDIAYEVGVSRQRVLAWRNAGRWNDERAERQMELKRMMHEGVEPTSEVLRDHLHINTELRKVVMASLKDAKKLTPGEVRNLSSLNSELWKTRQELLQQIQMNAVTEMPMAAQSLSLTKFNINA